MVSADVVAVASKNTDKGATPLVRDVVAMKESVNGGVRFGALPIGVLPVAAGPVGAVPAGEVEVALPPATPPPHAPRQRIAKSAKCSMIKRLNASFLIIMTSEDNPKDQRCPNSDRWKIYV